LSCTVSTGVQQACCEFLQKQLDPSNCIGIGLFAENHGCEALAQAASHYTAKHFEETIKHDEFRALGRREVERIVGSDEIQVICHSEI
jgi:trehalose-6-phosphatase